jgi:hypothetical protein
MQINFKRVELKQNDQYVPHHHNKAEKYFVYITNITEN